MNFVAIAEHSPDQCPGHVKGLFDEVAADMSKLDDLQKKHNVTLTGLYIMYASHKTVVVMDAPSYEAAEMLLYDAGILSWNTVQLGQAHSAEEAMKLAGEYHSARV